MLVCSGVFILKFQFSPSKRKDYHYTNSNWILQHLESFNLVPPKGRIITYGFSKKVSREERFNLVPPKGRIITTCRGKMPRRFFVSI